jgi:hypothetical protein
MEFEMEEVDSFIRDEKKSSQVFNTDSSAAKTSIKKM